MHPNYRLVHIKRIFADDKLIEAKIKRYIAGSLKFTKNKYCEKSGKYRSSALSFISNNVVQKKKKTTTFSSNLGLFDSSFTDKFL